MPRTPHAAKALHAEVLEHRSKAKMEPQGDPDGLGVYRTFKFDKPTSKWLEPLLDVMADPRVESWHLTDAGHLHVTFDARSSRADNKAAFDLESAVIVAG